MSVDVRFGLIYGVEVWNYILEDQPIIEYYKIPTYDKYTGKEKGFESRRITKFKLLKTIIGLGSAGELIKEDDYRAWILSKRNEINNDNDHDGVFIYDYNGINYFGIKAFAGEEPYEYPQDMCIEYIDNTVIAKELWEQLFPYLEGKLLLYMRVSV
jgi:hypothetical protein